jgi:hypothetical protein
VEIGGFAPPPPGEFKNECNKNERIDERMIKWKKAFVLQSKSAKNDEGVASAQDTPTLSKNR